MFGRRGILAVGTAHLGVEVIRADEDRIDTGQAVDRLGVFDSLWRFGLQDDKDLIVGVLEVVAGRRVVKIS